MVADVLERSVILRSWEQEKTQGAVFTRITKDVFTLTDSTCSMKELQACEAVRPKSWVSTICLDTSLEDIVGKEDESLSSSENWGIVSTAHRSILGINTTLEPPLVHFTK